MDQLIEQGNSGKVNAFIIDCTDFALDEDSLSSELFTPEFYGKIFNLLSDGSGFSQQITDLICKETFEKRANLGGFGKAGIVMAKTPEYGGELPIAFCYRPP